MARSNQLQLIRQVAPYLAIAFLGGWGMGSFSTLQRSFTQETTSKMNMDSVRESAKANERAIRPDWRLTTDCGVYSRDCVLSNLAHHGYADYPFLVGDEYDHLYKWESKLPEGWKESFAQKIPKERVEEHPRSPLDVDHCLNTTRAMSLKKQVDHLLRARLGRELNMVAFTISDYSYTKDMMQDAYEMAHNVLGFKDAFFMVAIDVPTMVLACQHHYPFLAWPQPPKGQIGNQLKAAVASTKFDISYELVKRGQNFFFFEMDVWFLRSPKPLIKEQTADIVFSAHQNNPEAANIGVYSVIANNRTEEYFRLCIEIMKQSPETHDQAIMQQMYHFVNALKTGQPLKYGGAFKDPVPKIPMIKHPVDHRRYSPYQIAADERPLPNDDTIAIHTLCGVPLRTPHGKKMVAKELMAWYGSGSYYGKFNRYLWFDGHVWNGYSMVMTWAGAPPSLNGLYHNLRRLQWTIAVTIALARRTDRIWVMPKVLNDAGVQFIWTILDMQSVESLVEVRETNFPANPKSWNSPTVPFEPVARTALGHGGRVFVQLDANAVDTATDNIWSWKVPELDKKRSAFDIWFAIHSTIPELVEAEVLLVGMPVITDILNALQYKVSRQDSKLSTVEHEIKDVFDRLRWCYDNWKDIPLDHVAGYTPADWDCYGRGKRAGGYQ